MTGGSRRFAKAMKLLEAGHAGEALEIGNELVDSPDQADRISGYLCLAYVYEDGGEGVEQDLARAVFHFRQVSLFVDHAGPLCNIARVEFKQGHFDACLTYLERAGQIQQMPIVLLGLAHYHRFKPSPELALSKRYYLHAAMQGRFAGMFGYSNAARELDQPARALLMDGVRVLTGWFVALVLGSAATESFA